MRDVQIEGETKQLQLSIVGRNGTRGLLESWTIFFLTIEIRVGLTAVFFLWDILPVLLNYRLNVNCTDKLNGIFYIIIERNNVQGKYEPSVFHHIYDVVFLTIVNKIEKKDRYKGGE